MIDLKDMQKQVYQNKIDHGFDVKDSKENIYKHFCLLQGELAEAFDAYHKNLGTFGDELADVALYLFGLCEIEGINLEEEILKKFEIIKNRKYKKLENGTMVKDSLK